MRAAASRSCACEDNKTEGGCCCQDRGRGGRPETSRAAGAAGVVFRPDTDVAASRKVRIGAAQRAVEAEWVGDRPACRDRTPDRTQRLLNRAAWDTFAARSQVRRFVAADRDAAARRNRRRGGMVIGAIDETGQGKAGVATVISSPLWGVSDVALWTVELGSGRVVIGRSPGGARFEGFGLRRGRPPGAVVRAWCPKRNQRGRPQCSAAMTSWCVPGVT